MCTSTLKSPQGALPGVLSPRCASPGQEGLEGHAHWEVDAAGTHGLQDACLAQLLCHVPHIEEARKLWPWDRAMRAGGKGPTAAGNAGQGTSREGDREKGRAGVGGLRGQELRQLTFPGLGLRHWMK